MSFPDTMRQKYNANTNFFHTELPEKVATPTHKLPTPVAIPILAAEQRRNIVPRGITKVLTADRNV
jgi:hypothetical protein